MYPLFYLWNCYKCIVSFFFYVFLLAKELAMGNLLYSYIPFYIKACGYFPVSFIHGVFIERIYGICFVRHWNML